MIVFCPIRLKQTGGTSSFAKKLQSGLRPKGHHVIFKWQANFDILLVSPICPLRYLLYAKLTHKPIVHRLDGVYYPTSVAGMKYRLYNLPLQVVLHFFADYIIYQSKYSKSCCDKFLGANRFKPHCVIYNGVDTDHFSNHGPSANLTDSPEQKIFITVSRFRRSDQIIPLIKSFQNFQSISKYDAKLVIIGNFAKDLLSIPQRYANDPTIAFLGPLPNSALPDCLRAADVFLFTHLNPPCPNNVIEAMACGLPICGVNDGAMSELTTPKQNSELIPTKDDGFYTARHIDTHLFANNILKILNDQKQYATQSRNLASKHFTLRHMVNQYLAVFSRLSDPPTSLTKT